jgi:hypothetical protein
MMAEQQLLVFIPFFDKLNPIYLVVNFGLSTNGIARPADENPFGISTTSS